MGKAKRRVSSYIVSKSYLGFRFYTDSTYTRYYEILFILSASDVIGFDYWDNGSRIMYWRIYKWYFLYDAFQFNNTTIVRFNFFNNGMAFDFYTSSGSQYAIQFGENGEVWFYKNGNIKYSANIK